MPALIFDCDGVLADTEKDGHLRAFNQTFEHFNLPVHWTVSDYTEKLKIGGGKERLKSLLTSEFISKAKLAADPKVQAAAVADWHRYKTDIYTELVESGVMPARAGIARIAKEASAAGWKLAVASTSHAKSVQAVLTHAVGAELAARFAVFAGDIVPHKKPAPDIYRLALAELAVSTAQAIVIEDSRNGLVAATAAGLRTVVTISSFTSNENFQGASLVLSCLGDSATGQKARILENPANLTLGDEITLSDLKNILELPQ